MNFIENACPFCKRINERGAVVCRFCGSALNDPFMDPGAKTNNLPAAARGVQQDLVRDWPVDTTSIPANGIAVFIEGQSQPSFLDSQEEILIGRKAGDITDATLDLGPLGGYHLGISRRHALIRRTKNGYEVLDLGSLNGTFLNGQQLVPHTSYVLPSGSPLRLGSMRLLVHYRPLRK